MTSIVLLLQLAVAIAAGPAQEAAKPAYVAAGRLSLKVLLLEPLAPGGKVRLWLEITNEEQSVRVFCRPGWGYTYLPPNAQDDAWGASNASIHGCGDDDHDRFWALLPGESRLDSFEIRSPGSAAGTLSVDVEIEEHVEGGGPASSRMIGWRGLVSEAISSGDALRARRAQVKN